MIYLGFYLESTILLLFLSSIDADWGSPQSGQYHIQTDEGPERFFRYQTDSGQFRNEKRLRDGTVIGTEAWIDALGYLRQKDYIADKEGYRILKSKTIFVGKNTPIKEVISNGRINSKFNPATVRPAVNAIDDFEFGKKRLPEVLIHHNADPIDGSRNYIPPSSTIAPPVTTYRPAFRGFSTSVLPLSSTAPAYISSISPSTTPIPILSEISTPSELFLPPLEHSNEVVEIRPTFPSTAIPLAAYTADKINQELQAPSVEIRLPLESIENLSNDITQTAPTPIGLIRTDDKLDDIIPHDRPLFDRNAFYKRRANPTINSLNDDSKNFDTYTAQRQNGFAYFLPRHYHEETYNSENRDGSFGYIDPFGIRRVVYYRTDPNSGFKIRKNNRYVGFNAKPYDTK